MRELSLQKLRKYQWRQGQEEERKVYGRLRNCVAKQFTALIFVVFLALKTSYSFG